MQITVYIEDLLPNPHRDFERNPLDRARIDNHKLSIDANNGLWHTLPTRPSPTRPGKYETVFGHHRIAAAKECGITRIEITVKDLDDAAMIKQMFYENSPDFNHTADFEQEVIAAIVKTHAKAPILQQVSDHASAKGGAGLRIAPSFIPQHEEPSAAARKVAYSLDTLAQFLPGMPRRRIEAALSALALNEQQIIEAADFAGLGSEQARTVVTGTNRVLNETGDKKLAREVGNLLAAGMRRATQGGTKPRLGDPPNVTVNNANAIVTQRLREWRGDDAPQDLGPHLSELAKAVGRVFQPETALYDEVEYVLKVLRELSPEDREPYRHQQQMLMLAEDALRERAQKMVRRSEKLLAEKPKPSPRPALARPQ
jgi:hypothetical protein